MHELWINMPPPQKYDVLIALSQMVEDHVHDCMLCFDADEPCRNIVSVVEFVIELQKNGAAYHVI